MDPTTLVGDQIQEGQRLLDYLVRSGVEVQTSFWLMTSETGQWYLHVVVPLADQQGPAIAYRRILQLLRQVAPPFRIPLQQIKVAATDDSEPRHLRKHYSGESGGIDIRFAPELPGGVTIEGLYIYPIPAIAPVP